MALSTLDRDAVLRGCPVLVIPLNGGWEHRPRAGGIGCRELVSVSRDAGDPHGEEPEQDAVYEEPHTAGQAAGRTPRRTRPWYVKKHPLRAAALGHGLAMGLRCDGRAIELLMQAASERHVGVLRGGASAGREGDGRGNDQEHRGGSRTSDIVHRREHNWPQPVQQTGASRFCSGLNHAVRLAIGERTSQRWPTRPRATAEAVSIGEWLSDASGGWCARSSLVDQARRRAGSSPSWWC